MNIFIKSMVVPEEERLDNAMVSRWTKISLNNLNLFDETLYLDSDVLPVQPINAIWDFFKLGDILLSPDYHPQVIKCKHIAQHEIDYTLTICSPDAIQYR
jgi:alpha-N-acetylglucosamine transferase